jgi:ferritin-like protein
MKSTWEIINDESGKAMKGIDIQSLIINNEIMNQKQIANIFNNSRHNHFKQQQS